MLLLIILTLLVLLFLLSSPLLLYCLAWLSCDCVLTLLNLSAETCTPRQTVWDFLFYQEECSWRWAENQRPSIHSVNPATPTLLLLKEGMLYRTERERGSSIFTTEVTIFFVRHGFETFQTFQKQQSQVRYLPAHSQRFLILKLNWKKKNKSSNECLHFPLGKHICTVRYQKRLFGKDLKHLASFLIQMVDSLCFHSNPPLTPPI